MNIRKLKANEHAPMDLLLLADPSEEFVADYLEKGECFLAETEEDTIGVFVLLPTRPGTVELVNLAVSEPFQGRGIGKKLVTFAIQSARSEGYRTIEVGTGNAGIGQLALYQKCGFRITAIDFDFFY